ncbi:hypothetical protein [Lentzea sp. NPDC004782]|uniref:hypothetical protein n=1 Tax=Lentzea sp. NPDC004782 TaxID=3154458 RepID=UPI0033A28BFE
MKVGSVLLRRLGVGAMVAGISLAGMVMPAQAASPGSPEGTAGCSYFKRAQVKNKWEVLHTLLDGELRNYSPNTQMMVLERQVSDTRTTEQGFRADWNMFKAVFTAQVSQSVTESNTISTMAQIRIEVPGYRKYYARGSARQWYVQTEVTERSESCNYKTYQVEGIVATTDSIVWENWDNGPA